MFWNYSSPLLRIDCFQPKGYLKNLFSEEFSINYQAVPLSLDDNVLILASPDPAIHQYKKELEVILRRPVRFYLCTWVDYKNYRARCYEKTIPDSSISEIEISKNHLKPFEDSTGHLLDQKSSLTNFLLEHNGIIHYAPHLHWGSLSPVRGLELLLPEAFPPDHMIPFGWINGTLFCLIDDLNFQNLFDQYSTKLNFRCQAVLAETNVVNRFFKHLILRGQTVLSCSDKKMLEALIQNGSITREQGDVALQVEHQIGNPLKNFLLENHLIQNDTWLNTYSSQIGVIPLTSADIPDNFENVLSSVKGMIPDWIARKYSMLPLLVEEGTLLMGFSEINYRHLNLAALLTHLNIEPRLMDSQEIAFWIDKIYPETPDNEEINPLEFGSFLLNLGFISDLQYNDAALKSQSDWLDILVEKGYLKEQDLLEALGIFTGFPTLNLDHFTFNEELVRRYPSKLWRENNQIPLFENSHGLWIATSDPFAVRNFQDLERISGKNVFPILVPHAILVQMVQRYFSPVEQKATSVQITHFLDQLVSAGLITRNQANAAASEKEQTHCPLDQAILNNSQVAPVELAKMIAKIVHLKYEDLSLQEITKAVIDPLGVERTRMSILDPVDTQIARQISLKNAQQMGALPIRITEDQLVVAFADPFFDSARVNLELMLRRSVVPVITTRQNLNDAIQRTLGHPNLGTTLLMAGLITRSQLNNALDYAHRVNIRLGRALVIMRYISEDTLYHFLARQANLPFFDLSKAVVDEKAARLLEPRFERAYGLLPLAANDHQVVLATTDPHNLEGIERAKAALNKPVSLVLISESDLEHALEKLYHSEYLNESVSALIERAPMDSAYHVLTTAQKITLALIIILSLLWILSDANSYLVILNALITAFYLVFSIYKFRLIFKAISSNLEVPVSKEEVDNLQDSDLPIYTILVPVHREAEILADIINSLASIDYPAARLDILVLLEEDDIETIQKFDEINPPQFIQKVIIPHQLPKTKPKACNYGLIHARGEYIVIYDAEDLPERDQLKRILIAFSKTPENVACIQSKLNYYNRNQNIITQWFTVEYSMWFDLLLPGLDAEHAPIPLGGTSNHFKTYSLIEAGAWDPYNVTEDADLGIRLFKRGYRTRIVDSTTYEEANSQYNNWIRQRSRWLKGYMQTWLVHMRHPFKLIKEIGFNNFMSFQFIVGGTFFTALMNPIYWGLTALWFLAEPEFIHRLFPTAIFFMGAICLYVGTFVFTYVNVAGAMRRGYYDMVRTALLSPIYWAMSSIASWKGFVQLIFKPHFWEKTRHGLYQRPENLIPPEETEKKEEPA